MPPTPCNARLTAAIAALARIGADAGDLPALLQRTCNEVMELTGGNGAVVEQIEAAELVYLAASGVVADYEGLRIPREGSLSGHCVDSGQVQRCDDSETDPRVHREACRKIGARSMLIVPLQFAGQVLGVLKATADHCAAFDEIDQQVMELCAPVIAAALGRELRLQQRRQQTEQLNVDLDAARVAEQNWRQESLTDALTGLANRRQFEERIRAACAEGSPAAGHSALCFIDVNRFKPINDRYGHEVGDQALQLIARLLRRAARESDQVARLAGDEFVALLQPLNDPLEQAEWFARKLLSALAHELLQVDELRIPLSISIGIAVHSGPGLDRTTWLSRADQAMYQAKQSGGGHYRIDPGDTPEAWII